MLRDETPGTDKIVYIGQTLFPHQTIARIEPLASATSRGWVSVKNKEADFPNRGTVFSLDHLVVGRERGCYVLFTAVPTDRPSKGKDWDQLMTESVCLPYQVIRGFESLSADSQRELLFSKGFSAPLVQSPHVILPLGNNKYFRPLLMEFGPNRWVVSHKENLAKFPIYESTSTIQIDGDFSFSGSYFALPGRQPTHKAGARNLESDLEFIERLTKFLNKTSAIQPDTQLGQISRALVGRLRQAYSQAAIFNTDPAENDAIRERVLPFLKKLESGVANVESIVTELMANPKIRAAIDAKSAELLDVERDRLEKELSSQIRAKLDEDYNDARERIAGLQAAAEVLEDTQKSKQAELQHLEQQKIACFANAQAMLDTFVGRAKEGAQNLNSLVASARAFGLQLPGVTAETKGLTADMPPWAIPTTPDGEPTKLEDLPLLLEMAASKCGLPLDLMMGLDIATRAGEVPIVTGHAAEILLETYARSVSGGSMYHVLVDPTFLGVDDLWTHPIRKTDTPFAAAWRGALGDPNHLYLASIDGLDAEGLASWFRAFAVTFGRTRPNNLCVVATTQAVIDAGDNAQYKRNIVINTNTAFETAHAVLTRLGMPFVQARRLTGHLTEALTTDERDGLQELAGNGLKVTSEEALRLVGLVGAAKTWKAKHDTVYTVPLELLGIDTETHSSGAQNARPTGRSRPAA